MKVGDGVPNLRSLRAGGAAGPWRRRGSAATRLATRLLAAIAFLSSAGCVPWSRELPRPGQTEVGSSPSVVPARIVGNTLIVEARLDVSGLRHFIIDTGSSTTFVTPELAERDAARGLPMPAEPRVTVKSSVGGTAVLTAATISRITLGTVRFDNVPVLIYDCSELSAHFGIRIDGILGFPLFRETVFTLDYPHSRVVLRASRPAVPLPGETIDFNNASRTPLIPVRIGNRQFVALIDSGKDVAISINPIGLAPRFAYGPTEGPTVGTLSGEQQIQVARLAEDLSIGRTVVSRPVVEVTDELSAIGGALLRHFTLTFDQEHNNVTFERESSDPIAIAPLRSTGLSFRKSPAYWRVAGVIPGSPGDAADIEPGDLVTRINGEPVARWDIDRYNGLLATGDSVSFTFLDGKTEFARRLRIVSLVP